MTHVFYSRFESGRYTLIDILSNKFFGNDNISNDSELYSDLNIVSLVWGKVFR